MRTFLLQWRREMAAAFLSPIAWVLMAFFLAVMGFSFWFMADLLAGEGGGSQAVSELFGSIFFWIAVLVSVPVLTMRLFAEEKRTGTFEVLMTAPISTPAVVLAKFAGALGTYALMWAPTLIYPVLLHGLAASDAPPDLRLVATGYLGALLIGLLFIAIGLLASALTRNQVAAAIASFAVCCLLFMAGFLPYLSRHPWVQRAGSYASPVIHLLDLSRGTIDSGTVAFYVLNTALVLFATVRAVEAGRWR